MNTIKRIALVTVISAFYSSAALIAMEQTSIDLQELSKKLQRFNSKCDEVTQDEAVTIAEYLRNNPDVKQKYADLIEGIVTNTWHKATNCNIACETDVFTAELHEKMTQDTQKRDAAIAKALEHLACAQNCSFIFAEFNKLSEKK